MHTCCIGSLGLFKPDSMKLEGLQPLLSVCLAGSFSNRFLHLFACFIVFLFFLVSPLEWLADPLIHLHHLLVLILPRVQLQPLIDELVQAAEVHRGGLVEGLGEVVGELGEPLVSIIPGHLHAVVREGVCSVFP